MTKIKGKWIRQEDTELKILEKLLRKGPLKIPGIEDKNGKDRLSHTSVLKGISKLLTKRSIIIKDEDKSIPKRSVKTYEITPAGMYQYLEWIFPTEKLPEYSDDLWESIKKSGQKFRRQNITPHYFPIVDKYWEKLEQIGEAPSWWFSLAVGRSEFTKAPYARTIMMEKKIPLSYMFSFSVFLLDSDFDYGRSYELKISHIALVIQNGDEIRSMRPNDDGIGSYNQLQKTISNTITFLFFYSMLQDRIKNINIFKTIGDKKKIGEDIKILNSIISIINDDKELKTIFREHLAIIHSKIRTEKTINYLFQSTA